MNQEETTMLGGCLCGSVRYEILAEPITLYACHCRDCQTVSGASFVLAMRVPSNGIRVKHGAPKEYERPRLNGQSKNIFRCPDCLTALWGAKIKSPQYLTVYAGTLEKSSDMHPVAHIWTCEAQPWILFPDGILKYEQGPSDDRVLADAWKAREK